MKTIGLIGGMSWESTLTYYQLINQGIKEKLGGLHSAKVILHSVDFAEIESLQHLGDWQQLAENLKVIAKKIEVSGADTILICTNTMHKVAPAIELAINIPLLHIADATAHKLLDSGIKTVGLLGTKFTMEQDFYKGRLQDHFGIQVITPDDQQRNRIHDIIYNELCLGEIKEQSAIYYLSVIDELTTRGAQAVILGCTEIGLLIQQNQTKTKLLDTTEIHAKAAVDWAIT